MNKKKRLSYLTILLLVIGQWPVSLVAKTPIVLDDGKATKENSDAHRSNVLLKRIHIQELMQNAYAKYEYIPEGLLENLAYSVSRWNHRIPKNSNSHHGMPQAIGLFGLYPKSESGFVGTLAIIAKAKGLTSEQMLSDESLYVDATASYINDLLAPSTNQGKNILAKKNPVKPIRAVLSLLSGIENTNAVSEYAINSYSYDVLSSMAKGFSLGEIVEEAKNVDVSTFFTSEELKLLGAPQLIIDQAKSTIETSKKESIEWHSKEKSVEPELNFPTEEKTSSNHTHFQDSDQKKTVSSALTRNKAAAEYPGALWVEAANYSSRNGSDITHIVIHTMQGSYSGSINYFQQSSTQASAHYMLRSSDGQITQMVHDVDKAWHVRSANPYTIGIEHEGFVDDVSWYTEEMYTESAKLTAYKCVEHSIDCTKAYAGPSHDNVVTLNLENTVMGHQHYPDQTHTDPGINWDWPYYYSLVNNGVVPNVFPDASFSFSCNELACSFDASTSSDVDGNITSYEWDFKDGNLATGVNVSHTFQANGLYLVKLTVTDDSTAASSIEVKVNASKTVAPTPTPESSSGGGSFGVWGLALLLVLRVGRSARAESKTG